MRRLIAFAVAAIAAVSTAHAQCTPILTAFSTTKIAINCPKVTGTPAVGDPVTLVAGAESIATTVTRFTTSPLLGTFLVLASVDSEPEKLRLINNESTVKLTVGADTFSANVQTTSPDYLRYAWSVGPATTGDPNGGSGGGSNTAPPKGSGALRLQLSTDYASNGMFGTRVGTAQTLATVDVDTTDQHDPSFIDNNRATVGFRWNVPPAGNLLKQGAFGFEGRATKAAHRDVHDIDAALTFSGWLPVLHTLNLFNRDGDFISAPLSFTMSYGYRNRGLQGQNFHGNVFEATALYHLFAVDRYKVDFGATWTVNDLTNRPASTPRSQRMYKASVSYLADPAKGFSVLTTMEDGSAGVMLTKVRQYFVGLALSKLSFSGAAK